MTPQEIEELINRKVEEALTNFRHTHDGINSSLINGEDVKFQVVTSAPTDTPPEGTVRIRNNGGTITVYVRANKTWKYKTFDNT